MAPSKRMQLWPFEKERDHFVKKLCVALRHIEDMRKSNLRQNGTMRRMQIKAADVKNKIFMLKEGLSSEDVMYVDPTSEIILDLVRILENDLKIFTDRLDDDKATVEKVASEIQAHYMRLITAMNRMENITRQEMRNMAMPTVFWVDKMPATDVNALTKMWRQGKFEQRVDALSDKISNIAKDMRT